MEISIWFFLYLVAYFAGGLVGLAVGSVFSAVWLRVAASFLSIGEVAFGTAFRCCLIVNLVNVMVHLSIGFNLALSTRLSRGRNAADILSYGLSSVYFLYSLVFSLVLMAFLIRRFVTDENGLSLNFGDSFSLSSLHFAVSTLFLCLLATVISAGGMALLDWPVL